MNNKCYINEISIATPTKVRTNEDIADEFGVWSADEIYKKTGISNRHIAENEDIVGMCYDAYNEGSKPQDIDYLIVTTQNPDYKLPTTACILQDRLSLDTSIGAIDINQGCSGYLYSLSVAKGLICSGIVDKVAIFTADKYTSILDPDDRGNATLFGDASTCTIISNKEHGLSLLISDFIFGTDGSGYDRLIVKNGGSKNRIDGTRDDYLQMNGKDIFTFTLKEVPKIVSKCLLKNNLNDANYYVFHQANMFILENLRRKMGINKEKFLCEMDNFGNTVSSTIPIVLFYKNTFFKSSENILIAGFGVGLSMSATVLKKS